MSSNVNPRRAVLTATQRGEAGALIEHAPMGMMALAGPEHVFVLANEVYRAMVGHRELLGRSIRDAFPELAEQGIFELLDSVYRTGEVFQGRDIPVMLERDGVQHKGFYTFTYSPVRGTGGHVESIHVYAVETTEQVRAENEQLEAEAGQRRTHRRITTMRKSAQEHREQLYAVQAAAAERQALLTRLVMAQEEERRRVAHEVHDGITQLASAAALHLDELASLLPDLPPAAQRELDRARELARRAAAEARRLIAGLRPEVLDEFGLAHALRQEVAALQEDGWRATFEAGGTPCRRMTPEQEITFYRVAQEALTNVRKHAGLCRVCVRLEERDGGARMEVRDWGCGFDPGGVRPGATGESVGLTGMRERMALVGGRLEIRSSHKRGATVRAHLPLRDAP